VPATASSTVGVVASPRSVTVIPMLLSVLITRSLTTGPEILASRPTTILRTSLFLLFTQEPKAALNFTISTGVRFSPDLPPIVPLIPDIDFIKVIVRYF